MTTEIIECAEQKDKRFKKNEECKGPVVSTLSRRPTCALWKPRRRREKDVDREIIQRSNNQNFPIFGEDMNINTLPESKKLTNFNFLKL